MMQRRLQAALVFHGVVQKSRDHHVLRHIKGDVADLSHHQRSNTEKMSHVGHFSPFADASVYLPCIVNGVRETLCEDECLHRESQGCFGLTESNLGQLNLGSDDANPNRLALAFRVIQPRGERFRQRSEFTANILEKQPSLDDFGYESL